MSSLIGISGRRRRAAGGRGRPITGSRHEEGLGMGDVKMLAMIGAFLGWKLTLLHVR